MLQKFSNVYIESISSCVPANSVGNPHFSDLLSPKELRVFEKTVGIRERRWAEESTTASDLGYEAALEIAKTTDKDKIKGLIFLSQTSDYRIPFTSNILQARLGLSKETLCLDINAGCAGFIQGLSTAFSIAGTLQEGEKVLLIIAETLSKILSPTDKSTNMLFGDGASAVLVSKREQSATSYFNFFSDGDSHRAIIMPESGFRKEKNDADTEGHSYLTMEGSKVFDFTLREIAPAIESLVRDSDIPLKDIGGFFFHQSNQFIIRQIQSMLAIEAGQVPINIEDFGNTSGVSIPLLITTHAHTLPDRSRIMCSGYGSGLSWGNCIIDLSETDILPLKEI